MSHAHPEKVKPVKLIGCCMCECVHRELVHIKQYNLLFIPININEEGWLKQITINLNKKNR